MKILIICSNRNRQPIAVMPFGACIIAEASERAGHKVSLLDLMFVDDVQNRLEHAVETANPDVVGISIRNIDNNDMKNPQTFFDEVTSIVKVIRKKPTL